jgi:hypothetical protein
MGITLNTMQMWVGGISDPLMLPLFMICLIAFLCNFRLLPRRHQSNKEITPGIRRYFPSVVPSMFHFSGLAEFISFCLAPKCHFDSEGI